MCSYINQDGHCWLFLFFSKYIMGILFFLITIFFINNIVFFGQYNYLSAASTSNINEELLNNEFYSLFAKEIDYNYTEEIIYARDNVKFEYIDFVLEADKIVINLKKNQFEAGAEAGNWIDFYVEEEHFQGKSLKFDFEKNTGSLFEAKGSQDNINFSGGEVKLLQTKEYEMAIDEAFFTPCLIEEEPHYHFTAEAIYIYPGEKIVGENIAIWFKNKKIISLPYYTLNYEEINGQFQYSHPFPVSDIGYNSEDGFNFEIIYPYQVGDRLPGEIHFDFNHKSNQYLKFKGNIILNNYFTLENELFFKFANRFKKISQKSYLSGLNFNLENIDTNLGYIYKEDGEVVNNYIFDFIYEHPLFILKGESMKEFAFFKLYFPEFFNINSEIGLGSFYAKKEYINRGFMEFNFDNNIKIGENIDLKIKKELSNFLYNTDNEYYNSAIFDLNVEANIFGEVTDDFNIDSDFGVDFVKSGGDFLRSEDKMNDRLNFFSNLRLHNSYFSYPGWKFETKVAYSIYNKKVVLSLNLSTLTSLPQSRWNFNAEGKYNFEDDDYQLSLGIKRDYDCYNWGVNYNFSEKRLEVGLNF